MATFLLTVSAAVVSSIPDGNRTQVASAGMKDSLAPQRVLFVSGSGSSEKSSPARRAGEPD